MAEPMLIAQQGSTLAHLLPELANRQVLKDLKGPITDTVPSSRPILVRDLMNSTLGFGVLFDPTLPIQQAIDERQLVNGQPVPATPWTSGAGPPCALRRRGLHKANAQHRTVPFRRQAHTEPASGVPTDAR